LFLSRFFCFSLLFSSFSLLFFFSSPSIRVETPIFIIRIPPFSLYTWLHSSREGKIKTLLCVHFPYLCFAFEYSLDSEQKNTIMISLNSDGSRCGEEEKDGGPGRKHKLALCSNFFHAAPQKTALLPPCIFFPIIVQRKGKNCTITTLFRFLR
jgi:hypothetical protein